MRTFFLTALMAASASPAFASPEEERVARLEEQIKALQTQVEELKKQVTKPLPSWKGSPEFADKEQGWTFKPKGRFHYDTGYIGIPGAYSANRNLGFNSRVRRVTLGGEGTMPGGFAYKIEADFANNSLNFEETTLSYTPRSKDWTVRAGFFDTLSGLEPLTSSNAISFLERATLHEAFNNAKRVGAAFALVGNNDVYRLEAGLFAAHGIDASFDNDGWIAAGRAVWAPEVGGGRLHIAANAQRREFQANNGGVASVSINAPATNQVARYRARPLLQTTDVRFIDTSGFAAKGDTVLGLEFAGVFKPFYFAGEAQWLKTRSYRPGVVATGLDAFASAAQVTPLSDPSFFGAYGEIGWFITGEARGYTGGNVWTRPKVLNPISKGGPGAFQLAARMDYVDLDSSALKTAPTTNTLTGATSLAALDARRGRGGTQTGYALGLNWYPLDYFRLMLNYVHLELKGGPFASQVTPISTAPVDDRSYSTDGVALRAAVEF